MTKLVDGLHDEGRYLEIADLLAPYLPTIKSAIDGNLPLQRQRKWIIDEHTLAVDPDHTLFAHRSPVLPQWIGRRVRPLASLLPSRRAASKSAEELLDIITQSDGLREALVRFRPLFGVSLLRHQQYHQSEFTRKFIQELILNRASQLRRELEIDGPMLTERQPILMSLVGDPSFASEISVWKPAGDAVIELILGDATYQLALNLAPPTDDEKLLQDPTFCVILMFDAMIKQAAQNGHMDHMWLTYMSEFVRRIDSNYDPAHVNYDPSDEFPTLGTRIIWEAFCCLRGWIDLADDLPPENPHVSSDALGGEGASIPYWAAHDLCNAMRIVARSPRLPERFRVGSL